MYRLRILAQGIVALFVAISAAVQFRGEGRVPLIVLVTACLATLWLVSCRTTWLPFLGPTVMPTGVFQPIEPRNPDLEVILEAPENAVRVVFWASSITADDPITAYGGFSNAGVADVSDSGTAVLRIRRPVPYAVAGTILAPHVHYRWITATGMLSSVKTVKTAMI